MPLAELDLEEAEEEVAQSPPAAVPKPHLWDVVEDELETGADVVEDLMLAELETCEAEDEAEEVMMAELEDACDADDVGGVHGLVGTAMVTI